MDELDKLHRLMNKKEWLAAKNMATTMLLEIDTGFFLRSHILHDLIKVCNSRLEQARKN